MEYRADFGYDSSPDLKGRHPACLKALAIDPSLPDALAMLGWIAAAYDYDWKEAERLIRSAMAANPVSPTVHWLAGRYLLSIGHFKPAMQEIERALEADPLNISYRRSLAFCMSGAGHEADAAAQCRRNVEFDENDYWSYFLLSLIHAQRGDIEAAVQLARKAYSLAPWFLPVVAILAGVLMRTGDTSEAATILRKLGDGQEYGATGCGADQLLAVTAI
jgi:tetratricopeptide (TPR) repeat protein